MNNNSISLSCKHPLPVLLVPSKKLDKNGNFISTKNVIFLKQHNYLSYIHNENFSWLPCGRCIACRLKHSYDWSNRLMLEAQKYENNFFVTLTYDDEKEHLDEIKTKIVLKETGEVLEENALTLRKRHLQLFMKRLRKHFEGTTIRFYACGEYGSTTYRPHYHLILFNVPFSDLKTFRKGKMPYYISPTLAQLWPYGYHIICPVSWDTCSYVGGYVLKKSLGTFKKFEDEIFGQENEFSLMSRRPGIARDYYDLNKKEIYKFDELIIPKGTYSAHPGSRKVKPSKYFDKLYDIYDHDDMARIKDLRKQFAKESQKQKELKSSLSHSEILQAEERQILNKQKQKIKII